MAWCDGGCCYRLGWRAPQLHLRQPRHLPLAAARASGFAETSLEDDLMGLGITGSTDASSSKAYEDSFM